MDMIMSSSAQDQVKKGLWSAEEDSKLIATISVHGVGRWNSLAQSAGLQRSGKSCRLRWLNYLRPDIRHGGFTLEEQLLILQLHFRWGNRWSKIAQQLPGRTDNDIKNYWRSRVLKHAKCLNCHVDSSIFNQAIHHIWIPHLLNRVNIGSGSSSVGALPPVEFCNPIIRADDSGSFFPVSDPLGLGNDNGPSPSSYECGSLFNEDDILYLQNLLFDKA